MKLANLKYNIDNNPSCFVAVISVKHNQALKPGCSKIEGLAVKRLDMAHVAPEKLKKYRQEGRIVVIDSCNKHLHYKQENVDPFWENIKVVIKGRTSDDEVLEGVILEMMSDEEYESLYETCLGKIEKSPSTTTTAIKFPEDIGVKQLFAQSYQNSSFGRKKSDDQSLSCLRMLMKAFASVFDSKSNEQDEARAKKAAEEKRYQEKRQLVLYFIRMKNVIAETIKKAVR